MPSHTLWSAMGPGCVKTKSDLVVMPRGARISAFFCFPRDHTPQNSWCAFTVQSFHTAWTRSCHRLPRSFATHQLRRRERKPHLIRREIVFRERECGRRRVSGSAEKLFCAYPNQRVHVDQDGVASGHWQRGAMLAFHFITKVEKRLVGVSESGLWRDSGIRGAYSRGYTRGSGPVGACCGVIGTSM